MACDGNAAAGAGKHSLPLFGADHHMFSGLKRSISRKPFFPGVRWPQSYDLVQDGERNYVKTQMKVFREAKRGRLRVTRKAPYRAGRFV
jgi:hypothetical protein